MLRTWIAAARRLIAALLAHDGSSQLAAGFTIGMIIGLVPKGNLIALSLCVLLFSLRCNKGLALVAAIVFSCVGQWTDPLAHKIGAALLTINDFQAHYAALLNMPLGPWLGFNNTVVAGSLALGVYFAYPAYYVSHLLCDGTRRLARRASNTLANSPPGACA